MTQDDTSLIIATVTTVLSGILASSPRVSRLEISLFRWVNTLPPSVTLPLAALMQFGALGAVPLSAATARLAGRKALASDLTIAGGTAWVLAKAIKLLVVRQRPGLLLPKVLLRGRRQHGLGFPSGHAAVAAALTTAASSWVNASARRGMWATAGSVGIARIYIGAHLPLDVVGGAALGAMIGMTISTRRDETN